MVNKQKISKCSKKRLISQYLSESLNSTSNENPSTTLQQPSEPTEQSTVGETFTSLMHKGGQWIKPDNITTTISPPSSPE